MYTARAFYVSVTALALTVSGHECLAQDDSRTQRLARVTVDSAFGDRRLTGRIADTSPDSITLVLDHGGRVSIPRDHVTRLELSQGTRARTGKDAVTGALIGLGAGAAVGVVYYASLQGDDFFQVGPEVIVASALGGGIWGLAVGAVVGALSREPDWSDADHRVGPSPSGVGVAIRF